MALYGLLGGALIGLAASLALFAHGRVAGVSGIIGRALDGDDGCEFRWAFLAGMVVVGLIARAAAPGQLGGSLQTLPVLAVAGLLVGVGTTLSNGCTSGHGVCGLSRGSPRSLVAVGTFVVTAAITVAIVRGMS
ncbi:MAG: YeeE/YedE family protein [Deltaproteobacteria bacterium]|nr:YeeE/YedE family protein [Deltaproteobacteria bacterium]